MFEFHKRVVIGVEVEAYSIDTSDYRIGRRLSKPRPGLSESGEQFARDTSIGSEYNSRPYSTVREAFFLLKSGLRKYLRRLYRAEKLKESRHLVPLLVGGWTDRLAGAHLHLSITGRTLRKSDAASLARHIHDHIPFLIAIGSNSPVWERRLTHWASNRIRRGSETYFRPTRRGDLRQGDDLEIRLNPGRKRKPPTLELRVLDSNIPEFLIAELCLVKAMALRWLRRRGACHRLRPAEYLRARDEAARKGMRARLPWGRDVLSIPQYLDRFVREHYPEFKAMDIPDEIDEVLRLLKRRVNGAEIIRAAAVDARRAHPQTWQKRFAKRYTAGLEALLSGNSLRDFARALKVPLPAVDSVWLGRKGDVLGS